MIYIVIATDEQPIKRAFHKSLKKATKTFKELVQGGWMCVEHPVAVDCIMYETLKLTFN